MDTAGQHSFLTPTTCFTVACVALSILTISTIWSKQCGTTNPQLEKKAFISQPRPQPRRRVAVDSLYLKSANDSHAADKPDISPCLDQPPVQTVSGLLLTVFRSGQKLLTLQTAVADARIAALLNELSQLSISLCRLQQSLSINPRALSDGTGLEACFITNTSGLSATLRLLQNVEDSAFDGGSLAGLQDAERQLKLQRKTFDFLIGAIGVVSFPPTPPMEDESNESPDAALAHAGYLNLPHPSPGATGLTPAVDAKGWIEPPPEYSPPARGSGYAVPEKSEQKSTLYDGITQQPQEDFGGHHDGALYQAVTDDDAMALTQLLKEDLDDNKPTDDLRRTPLHQAAHLNHCTCLTALLRHGASMSNEDAKGDTPLHLAAWAGHVEALSVLLAHGVDVDWLSGRDGYSPLWCAISAHHIDAARLLLKHGARVSLRSTSGGGLLPLHQAAVTGQSAMCELLLERGAQIDAVDDNDSTALHYAAAAGALATVQVLLKSRANVKARQAQGLTPAHWAAHKGHADVLALLLDHGTPVNVTAEDGATPLHLAANRGHLPAVRLLLEKGANRNAVAAHWDGVQGIAAEMARSKRHLGAARLISTWSQIG